MSPDVRNPHSIDIHRLLPWYVRAMMGVMHVAVWACRLPVEWTGTLPAEWTGCRLPAKWIGCRLSINAEAAHRVSVEWTGGAPYPQ
jgi:hypothetical protein